MNSKASPFSWLTGRSWILTGIGVVLFHVALTLAGRAEPVWLPALGIGLALVVWQGPRIVPLLAVDVVAAWWLTRTEDGLGAFFGVAADALLLTAEIAVAWWIYGRLGKGTRRLEDPQSATLFLILVPGVAAAVFALAQTALWTLSGSTARSVLEVFSMLWIARALGVLALAAPLLAVLTPLLVRRRLVEGDEERGLGLTPSDWTLGEVIETAGLCLGCALSAWVLTLMQVSQGSPRWGLWGISLLLVVWACLRQGLRGGALAALASALTALGLAQIYRISPADFSPLQGNLLAQCSAALLVGASAGWIRASEARYRQVVGHIPVVLYSVRLPRSAPTWGRKSEGQLSRPDSRCELAFPGPSLAQQAEVTLVSPACRQVLGCAPEQLLGPFTAWLDHVVAEDRELVFACLSQLCMQQQTVTCEYRVTQPEPATPASGTGRPAPARWVRDTLAPHYDSHGALQGWEGVMEDITEARALSVNLRRTTGMLQALVANFPTGVFFVQGPLGQPLLVNHRARQLLGQREEMAAGIAQLSMVYRLHRPDGTEYPPDELPVARALGTGVSHMANDVVVHRADGRRIPLVTWAAPIYLSGGDTPDAAVWVLEDLTALQQAESARRETEARLRAVFEAIAEGVVVINQKGEVVECNPAACAILQTSQDKLIGRSWLEPDSACIRPDGAIVPLDERPDWSVLRLGQPVRDAVLGVPFAGPTPAVTGPPLRWLYVNAMPLPVGTAFSPNPRQARAVVSFADITAHRQAEENVRCGHRLEMVGRLASGIVHDFNNLLTVMLGLAEMARGNLSPEHAAREDLGRLLEVGEHARALAGQLLAFSKQRRPTSQAIDVNVVVMHALKMLHSALPPSIQVEKQLAGADLLVQADETQLKQVIVNLCLNAREAMGHSGRITVRTEAASPPSSNGTHNGAAPLVGAAAPNGASAPNGWVRLSVQDTGAGMEEAVQARIFEPFFTTKERGTGLGLAVVRQIVEDFGGRIQVWSKPQEGTRMDIWLRASAPTKGNS